MTGDDDHLTIYADYVCPFCYLGKRSLETYQDTRDGDLEIEWHPFDLRAHKRGPSGEIDHSVADGKDESYFDQVRRNVERLRAEYGAEEMLDFDALPDEIDSFDAQAASWYVSTEHPDRWEAFDEAIYEALWIEGRDIGNSNVLADLAESVGLDGAEIQAVVADTEHRTRLRERMAESHQAGVTGVPTFVYEQYAARGAVPPEHLKRLVEGT